jgi:hypothetical protein
MRSLELSRLAIRNPETKPRPDKPDGLVFTMLEAEGLCDSARLRLGRPDQSDYYLPEAELCDTARATRRVNTLSPLVDSKGQRVLRSFTGDFTAGKQDAVGLRTPVATIQVL